MMPLTILFDLLELVVVVSIEYSAILCNVLGSEVYAYWLLMMIFFNFDVTNLYICIIVSKYFYL